jgi:MFS family permease
VLWFSAVLSRGAVSSMFPVSVLAISDLLGSGRFAGLSTGASTVGSAISAGALATYMQRKGRTPGLALGFAVAAFGGLLAIVAIQIGSLAAFLAGMIMVGVGSGTANLSRYAAADLSSAERRSRDISTVIFASTFGAVLFPLFIGVAGTVAGSVSLDENAGGFAMGIALFVLAAAATWLLMRPDPLVVAGGIVPRVADRQQRKAQTVGFREAIGISWSLPLARLALVALVVSQAVMVMVMAMTPLHMKAHGHTTGVVGAVISAHTAGMFAFAPVAGWCSDRFGRLPTIGVGGAMLIAATALTALAGEAPRLLMFPGLFLLGLGWSFGIVAASALLTESVEERDRVAVQGAADLATNIASGSGALASGIVLDMAGFHILSMMGMAAAGGLLVHSFFENRLAAAQLRI